jgi:uncharacterized protein YjbJ (UPF0337 family)
MNKDQVKGTLKEMAGKAQAKLGDVTDNPKQQAKGHAKAIAGIAQQAVGDAKALVKDAKKTP